VAVGGALVIRGWAVGAFDGAGVAHALRRSSPASATRIVLIASFRRADE
jgi:hypothetical protein